MRRSGARDLRARLRLAIGLIAAATVSCHPSDEARDAVATEQERAADFRAEAVEDALDAAERVIMTRGFEPEGAVWRGFLVRQSAQVVPINLHASTCYVLLGASSRALTRLDLRIYDSDGGELAHDGMAGPGAALRFCPPQSGTFYLSARASKGSGLFAVRRYVGPTGLDVRLSDLFEVTRGSQAAEATP